MVKLNVGSGSNVINGWTNIDINDHAGVMVRDVKLGLPFDDNSVDFIFSEHFIEHLTKNEGIGFFNECYRVLKPGGVVRTSTFDIDDIMKLCGSPEEWERGREGYLQGLFYHYTRVDFFNFCVFEEGAHKCMYAPEYLVEVLSMCKFTNFKIPKMRESEFIELQNLEWRTNSNCIVEAIK